MAIYKYVLSIGIGIVVAFLVQNVLLINSSHFKKLICDTFQYAYEKDTRIIEPDVKTDFIGLAETIHFNQDDQSQLSLQCEQDLFSFIELDLDNPMNTYQKCVQSVNTENWPSEPSFLTFLKSQSHVYTHSENGMHWNYLRNVCLDSQNLLLHLYQANQEDVEMDDLSSLLSILPSIQIEDVISPYSPSVWILYPSKELDAFFQQFALLHSLALHAYQFPPFLQLLIPTMKQSDQDERVSLLLGIKEEIENYHHKTVSFVFEEELKELFGDKKYLCLNGLTLIRPQQSNSIGNLFPSLYDSYLFRVFFYKYYSQSNQYSISLRKYQSGILYVTRYKKDQVAITINDDSVKYSEKNLHRLLYIIRKDLTKQSWSEIVKIVMKCDVLLGATGPALTLAVFLPPYSGLVEIFPENYRSNYFHNLAISSHLFYLAHYNFTDKPMSFSNCSYSIQDEEIWLKEPSCREALSKTEVYVPPITLWMILTDIANSVNHNKYHVYR